MNDKEELVEDAILGTISLHDAISNEIVYLHDHESLTKKDYENTIERIKNILEK